MNRVQYEEALTKGIKKQLGIRGINNDVRRNKSNI